MTTDTVNRDPSYPDRARIDSDVRAFLRPASTPWIVFDRDSRVDDFAKSALRVGAVFASTPSFRPEVLQAAEEIGKSASEVAAMPLPLPPREEPAAGEPLVREDAFRAGAVLVPAMSSVVTEKNMFPVSAPSPESVVEPSNLVVASDVIRESASIRLQDEKDESAAATIADPFAIPAGVPSKRRGRFAAVAGACAGVLALVGVSAVVLSGAGRFHAKATATTTTTPVAQMAAAAIPAVPVEKLELDSIPAPPPATTAEAAPVSTPEPAAPKIPTDPKKRFGKLTIKSEAKYKNVWFDGKRMLGNGQRSFLVFCGMHTIAVADKTDAKDVEVPCNGEYVVSK